MSDSLSTANRTRSPNYPVISLEDAIGKLRSIYDKLQQYPASREVLVKAMGYSGLTGTSAPIVSALAKYGLLEGYGETRKVSDLGRDLILHRQGDPEYAAALQEAAVRPAFFQDLNQLYPNGLPSDHLLRATLVKRGFNARAIDGAVRAYRETTEFVKAAAGTDRIELQHEPLPPDDTVRDRGGDHAPRQHRSAAVELDASQRSVILPLPGAAWATLQGPFPVTPDAWDQMLNVLAAMKPALVHTDPPGRLPSPAPTRDETQSGSDEVTDG